MRWNSCSKRYSILSALFPFNVCANRLPEMAVSCFESGRTCNHSASRSTNRQSSAACRNNPQTFCDPEPRSCATSLGSKDRLPRTPNCVCANAARAYVVAPRKCSRAARYVSQISLPEVADAWKVSLPDAAFQRCGGLFRLRRPTCVERPRRETVSVHSRGASTLV